MKQYRLGVHGTHDPMGEKRAQETYQLKKGVFSEFLKTVLKNHEAQRKRSSSLISNALIESPGGKSQQNLLVPLQQLVEARIVFCTESAMGHTQEAHPECNARVPAILEALEKAKLTPQFRHKEVIKIENFGPATADDIAAVHSKSYVRGMEMAMEKACEEGLIYVEGSGPTYATSTDGARTSGQQLRVPEHVLLDEGLAEAVERIWEAALASEEDVASQCAAGISELSRCMHETALAREQAGFMISRLIRAKASVPHDIIRAELVAPPLVVEALTRLVSFKHRLWDLLRDRYARLALESSRQLAIQGDTACWYGKLTSWFQVHGISMDRLTPFQYSLDAPSLTLTQSEITRLISQDLIQLDTKRTWIQLAQELGTKMAFYGEHLLQPIVDGFVMRPGYMDTHFSYHEIRGGFHCLFREGFGPFSRLMRSDAPQPEEQIAQ
ncbi:hypothetical protein L7F22_005251 [Adiantum nelumboides]|nr:hypothetical protein [Adiantum nelumboides]